MVITNMKQYVENPDQSIVKLCERNRKPSRVALQNEIGSKIINVFPF